MALVLDGALEGLLGHDLLFAVRDDEFKRVGLLAAREEERASPALGLDASDATKRPLIAHRFVFAAFLSHHTMGCCGSSEANAEETDLPPPEFGKPIKVTLKKKFMDADL